MRFARFTGLRSSEIVALRAEAVDLLHGRVHVLASATEAFRLHLVERRGSPSLQLPRPPLQAGALARAGLAEATRFHDLRYSYAAMLIAEGAHPRAIMERLGHSTIQVTLGTYGHLFPSLEASLTAALDKVYRGAEPTRPAEVREIKG